MGVALYIELHHHSCPRPCHVNSSQIFNTYQCVLQSVIKFAPFSHKHFWTARPTEHRNPLLSRITSDYPTAMYIITDTTTDQRFSLHPFVTYVQGAANKVCLT